MKQSTPLCFSIDAQMMFAAPIDATGISVDFCCRSAASYQTQDDIWLYIGYGLWQFYNRLRLQTWISKQSTRWNDFRLFSWVYFECNYREARVWRVLERNGVQWLNAKPVRQGPSMPYLPLPKQCNWKLCYNNRTMSD